MSKPDLQDRSITRFHILAYIRALDKNEREQLFKLLCEKRLFDDGGFILVPKEHYDTLHNAAVKAGEIVPELARQLWKTKRKPDITRLKRGRIIWNLHKDGISWKNMPAEVKRQFPTWRPAQTKTKAFSAESLRKMASKAADYYGLNT